MRTALIEEDIRKKINTVKGYQQEFNEVDRLNVELFEKMKATTELPDQQSASISIVRELMTLKTQAIQRKSQPSTPPPAK